MSTTNDFFDFDESLVNSTKPTKKNDDDLYDPSPSDGKNNSYKSAIRFIRYEKDHTKTKYKKFIAKLTNPLTKERMFIDCPSSAGLPSILWSLDIEINAIKSTEPTVYAELKENFSRWYNFFSPIYIKQDPQKESVVGKIKWLKYGYQVDKMIQGELEPNALEGVASVNPFHYLNGKDYLYVVSKKTKTFNDYTESKFVRDCSPFIYMIGDKTITVKNDPKVIELTQKFLIENTPSVDQFLAKTWTDADYAKVAEFIKAAIPYPTLIARALSKCQDTKIKEYLKAEVATSNAPTKTDSASIAFTGHESHEDSDSQIEVEDDEVANLINNL